MKNVETFEPDYTDLMATIPVGIARVEVREAWKIIQDIQLRDGSLMSARHDQNVICTLVNASVIASANVAAAALLEADGTEGLNIPVALKFNEDARRIFVEGLLHIFEGHGPFSSEAKVKHFNGNEDPIVLSVWSPQGAVLPDCIGLGLTNLSSRSATDITKENLRGELAHAARISMLGELTASIAHEVNQPLSSIVTNAEAGLRWLAREEPDLAEVKALLERIVKSGNRAADIVTTMRAMSQNTKPQRKSICLNTLVDEAALILRSELSKRQVALKLELVPNPPEALVDRTQILQVIVNLALNAAQAMADGQAWNRTLLIRTRYGQDAMANVEVEDSGPGVDPSVRERLFDSFYTTKETGVGMGLSICRSIIEAHGGSIELQSSPHLGARFSFTLPLSGNVSTV